MSERRTVQVSTYVHESIAELVTIACKVTGESRSTYLQRLLINDLRAQQLLEESETQLVEWNVPLIARRTPAR